MSSSFDLFLRRLRDPRWIPHISSYCDGRCRRCSFTERCWSYALREHIDNKATVPPGAASQDELEAADRSEPDPPPIQGWAERQGIDLNDLEIDAGDIKSFEQLQAKVDTDPFVIHVHDYGADVWKVMQPLLQAQDASPTTGGALHKSVAEAVEDLWGLALTIGAKTHRAVSSAEYEKEEQIETDAVQNDANGSAKVAQLAIVQSLAAYEIVQGAGLIDAGLVEFLVANLKQIEMQLATRFPLAMAFVRPGFDEHIPGIVRPWSIMPEEEDEEDGDT
jgi:hypothetical protein